MNKAKVLIVDDKIENLIAIEKVLRDFDVDFVRALSGEEALKLTIQNEFAIAIIDVHMPEMDGYETVTIMRQDEKLRLLPVIFVSAIYSDNYYKIKGIESGAVDFLSKPIIPEILIGKVNILLDLYYNRKKLENSNQFLSSVINNCIDSILVVDNNMKIKIHNRESLNLLEYSEDEITNLKISDIIYKDVDTKFFLKNYNNENIDLFFEYITGKVDKLDRNFEIKNAYLFYRTKHGNFIPVLFNAAIIKSQNVDAKIEIVIEAKNISYLKSMEKNVLENKLKYAMAFEIISSIYFEVSMIDNTFYANENWYNNLGYEIDSIEKIEKFNEWFLSILRFENEDSRDSKELDDFILGKLNDINFSAKIKTVHSEYLNVKIRLKELEKNDLSGLKKIIGSIDIV